MDEHGQNYEILKDNHFICDPDDFESFGANDKNQRMEFFTGDFEKRLVTSWKAICQ